MRDWAVQYRSGKLPAATWGVVVDVPDDVAKADVWEALQAWSRWPHWTARQAAGSRISVARSNGRGISSTTTRIKWEELAPAERRISLAVDGDLQRQLTMQARRAGASLQTYCVELLAAGALAAEEASA